MDNIWFISYSAHGDRWQQGRFSYLPLWHDQGSEIWGPVAQLGERLLCKQEVVGSIPSGSTKIANIFVAHWLHVETFLLSVKGMADARFLTL